MKEKWYLGIDIGGTSAKYAPVSEQGELLSAKKSFATGFDKGLDTFLDALNGICEEAAQSGASGFGICTLGVVHPETGIILGGVDNMPALKGLDLKRILSKRHPKLPVSVSNDVKAVARAEQWVGAARNCSNFICLTLGTGLGGAVVLDSKIVEGAHFRAGEVCAIDYCEDGRSLEQRVSTKAVMGYAAQRLGLPQLNGIEFFDRVRMGDTVCTELLDDWMEELSLPIANFIALLDVELILIGGGVSVEREWILPRLRAATERRLPPEMRGQARIETALCANNAGILGAVRPLI